MFCSSFSWRLAFTIILSILLQWSPSFWGRHIDVPLKAEHSESPLLSSLGSTVGLGNHLPHTTQRNFSDNDNLYSLFLLLFSARVPLFFHSLKKIKVLSILWEPHTLCFEHPPPIIFFDRYHTPLLGKMQGEVSLELILFTQNSRWG